MPMHNKETEKRTTVTIMKKRKKLTLISAASNKTYLQKLKYCMPTWKYCGQFRDAKVVIFYDNLKEKDFDFASKIFPEVRLVKWENKGQFENEREQMLSSFVLGVADNVDTEYHVKLDADTWLDQKIEKIFEEEHFTKDIVSHKWGYTKPGYWVDILDNFLNNTSNNIDKSKSKSFENRIQSICCLARTEFITKIAQLAGDRLPVPSHDTYIWYMADRIKGCSWDSFDMKKKGVKHSSKVKTIREEVCSNKFCFENSYLNEILFNNIQIHTTYNCNCGCNNCDRICGLNKTELNLKTETLKNEVQEWIRADKKWKRIDIIGGEPSCSDNLYELIDILLVYKEVYPRTKLRYSTNGLGDKAKEVIEYIKERYGDVKIRNSEKNCKEQDFECVTDAPIDKGCNDPISCSIPWRCGIGYNNNGYYLCGAGSGISRVLGIEGLTFKDLNIQNLAEQKKKLCMICGHSNYKQTRSRENVISNFWENKLG